jgi:hypothetical protein
VARIGLRLDTTGREQQESEEEEAHERLSRRARVAAQGPPGDPSPAGVTLEVESPTMATARPWTVNKPGPLTQRDEGLWTIDDDIPGIPGANRRMSVVKRADGTLLFYNGIPVDDATLDRIRELGKPAHLIVPNQYHALDVAAFAHRLGLTAYSPVVAVEKLAARLTCLPITSLPQDPSMRLFRVEGFKTHEVVLLAGKTLLVADLVTNSPHASGFSGFLMKLVGFTGTTPMLPKPVRRRVGKDLGAVRELMNELAALDGWSRIIPSHGSIVETAGPAALRAIALTL